LNDRAGASIEMVATILLNGRADAGGDAYVSGKSAGHEKVVHLRHFCKMQPAPFVRS
jgi:hypothetical protein